jgi:phospho-N-acetylmuramoyl-pentapeptide-transferase
MNAILAFFLFGFLTTLISGYPYIPLLKRIQAKGQPIREDGPQHHRSKSGTPTMGGILIVMPVIYTLLFAPYMWQGVNLGVLVVFLGYAIIGAIDDLKKVIKHNAYGGMTPRQKLVCQVGVAALGWLIIHMNTSETHQFTIFLPLINITLNLWYAYIPFALFIIVGASNAVNLTDGLDGLVTVPTVITLTFFVLLMLWIQPSFMTHLSLQDVTNLSLLIIVIIGSCLGFLFFNLFPARLFMGDVGSLSLGGLLGVLSIVLKAEIFLAITGFVFVIETISVMIQVVYFRRTGKRFFKMAPLHHHFEQLGWSEVSVVNLFWLISALSGYLALGIAALGQRL